MPLECLTELALVYIPELDQFVIGGGDQHRAIHVEIDALDWGLVTIHDGALCASIVIPDSNSRVSGGGSD